jgi:hypothetical protein
MFYMPWIAPKWTRGKSISKQIAVQISIILGEKVEGWESELKEGAATQVLENRNEVYLNKANENKWSCQILKYHSQEYQTGERKPQ